MEFLAPYITPVNIGILVAFVALLVFLWYRGQKKEVLGVISYLVDYAEKKFGSGTGEYKYNFVMTTLYPKLPALIRVVISPKTLDAWIEKEVDRLQARLKKEIEEQS